MKRECECLVTHQRFVLIFSLSLSHTRTHRVLVGTKTDNVSRNKNTTTRLECYKEEGHYF